MLLVSGWVRAQVMPLTGIYSPGHNVLELNNGLVPVSFATSKTKFEI